MLASSAVPAAAQGRGGGRAGDFDFYVLALSWSPTYCANKGDRPDGAQCGGNKSFAFVTHGLWPQYERGFPSDCFVTGRNPTRAQVDELLDIMPSPGLIRYQWRKHGTCSGLDPRGYFEQVRAAYEKVVIPTEFQQATDQRDVSPAEVERAFVDANRGMKPSGVAVSCVRGDLQEVRICLSKDLEFRPCAEVDRRACRASRVSLPAAGTR
nr:ribonuclease T2 [Methylopila sp. M107]